MEKFKDLLNGIRTLAIVCFQWGDTGKGKFVDLFAEWADIIARGTGADNAGHTIIVNLVKHVMHLVPCGILWDKAGKINVIGSGVAINPAVLLDELAILQHGGLSYNHLKIALNAKLTLPQHILLDRLKESGSAKIGTTGRGVGPVFVDHYARIGLIMNDLLNPEVFRKKFKHNLVQHLQQLLQYDTETVRDIMFQPHLDHGSFYHPETIIDAEAVINRYLEYGRLLRPFICDTDAFMRANVGQKNILLEGAQGLFLSVDKGNYPYVTSSDCSDQGLAKGVGLRDKDLDLVLGIVKAFYMTRVGAGPFPTEFGGKTSADWCSLGGVNEGTENNNYQLATVNSEDEFIQGIGVRMAGNEYGATTGRPRRTGWLDLPMLRYAIEHCGPNTIFTKLDVLSECDIIKLCVEYLYTGPTFNYGLATFNPGDHLQIAIPYAEVMAHCQPVYQEFPGWLCDISQMTSFEELPNLLKQILFFTVLETDVKPRLLSVGPDRNQTIFL